MIYDREKKTFCGKNSVAWLSIALASFVVILCIGAFIQAVMEAHSSNAEDMKKNSIRRKDVMNTDRATPNYQLISTPLSVSHGFMSTLTALTQKTSKINKEKDTKKTFTVGPFEVLGSGNRAGIIVGFVNVRSKVLVTDRTICYIHIEKIQRTVHCICCTSTFDFK
ncbi:uncharacterized protein LOC115882324 [Sitophilus oryzae]|uniref:Uncharacterized protein LOC115882324 n=1 Tax=Sitophilus oryzae TaxID=7048 RepID=A0A6J2XYN6_SITOR|nr:uncharacterized protein LOC115882324 [Sitophilus oryzae]